MNLNQILQITISRATAAITAAGFGTPLILGSNAAFSGTRSYADLTAVATDFATGTAEYKKAQRYFGQSISPSLIKIGKQIALVAQIDTITPTAVNLHVYTVTISFPGGTADYTYTADGSATAAEIVTGLSSLINADSAAPCAATGSTTLILTSKNAGQGFTTNIHGDADLALVHTTPVTDVAAAIASIALADNDWYFFDLVSENAWDVLSAAGQIEGMDKIFVSATSDTSCKASTTTDVGAKLNGLGYNRSAAFYSGDAANYPDSAWGGRVLPLAPGSENWAYKSLTGITADALTATETTNLTTKKINFYTNFGGQSVTFFGTMASGEYIDVIRGIDALKSDMQVRIASHLINLDKVPLNDAGIAVIEGDMRAALDAAVASGLLTSYTVTVPKAKDLPTNAKALRTLSGLKFTGVLAGAVNLVQIAGNITL